MSVPTFVKAEKISIASHPELNERWVQDRIAEDPTILGLGEVILKDKERTQPKAGRLDFLLREAESTRRYEVEVQLGKTDASHIMRTIEYWDIERKRYPQYDHCAVIVAEDITSRFLNVIGLFNGAIPLIAIKMNALKINDQIALTFTTVIDELALGLEEDDVDVQPADRAYWESRATKETLLIADKIIEIIRTIADGFKLNYNKAHIGLAKNGQPNNFVYFKPTKSTLILNVKLEQSEETQAKLEDAGLDVMDYHKRDRRYCIRLTTSDVKKHEDLLTELIKQSYGKTLNDDQLVDFI